MLQATLCFLVKKNEVLLGLKKRGFGVDRWNGYGGKLELSESIEEAAVRELKEESGVTVSQNALRKVAVLDFYFTNAPPGKVWDQTVHIYLTDTWSGTAVETEEMLPKWFSKNELPFVQMWKDDAYWLPRILAGQRLRGKFTFGEDNLNILNYELSEVKEL